MGSSKNLSAAMRQGFFRIREAMRVLHFLFKHAQPFDSKIQLKQIMDIAPNAMIVVNQQGTMIQVNTQTEQCFGFRHEELLGQPIEKLVPERYRSQHRSYLQYFVKNPQIRAMGAGRDLLGLHKDGMEIPIEIGLNPIQSSEGMFILCSIIDISERKAIEKKLKEYTEQLAQSNRYKSEFLSNMSHELRTPLNCILILSEQLSDSTAGTLTPKQIKYANIIHHSGQDLLNLINDILDLSRIDAGHIQIHPEKVVLTEFFDYLQQTLIPLAEDRKLTTHLKIADNVPQEVVFDMQRVLQIMKNLFSNAVKFTQAGGEIHIGLIMDTLANQAALAFYVRDTGAGIPSDKQDIIFQPFQQLDGFINRKFGGTGLGLAISRQLAECLEGTLTVASQEGQGSTFTLRLPLILHDPELLTPEATPILAPDLRDAVQNAPSHAKGWKILLVDDDVRNACAMSSVLEDAGMQIEVARNGAEALDAVRQKPEIDLVLMDMMMPVLDGFLTTTTLRHGLNFKKPILAITASAMKGDRERCLAAGADEYLAKPIKKNELLALINKFLSKEYLH